VRDEITYVDSIRYEKIDGLIAVPQRSKGGDDLETLSEYCEGCDAHLAVGRGNAEKQYRTSVSDVVEGSTHNFGGTGGIDNGVISVLLQLIERGVNKHSPRVRIPVKVATDSGN